MMKSINQKGFTIMELMIATAVFSIVLLVAQESFLQIGKLNSKGLTSTRTQGTATQILAEIKSSIKTAPPNSISTNSQNGYTYFCAGGNRYTYNLGKELDLTVNQSLSANGNGNYGILEDSLPGAGACAPPCVPAGGSCPPGTTAFNNPTELLGGKMRLDQLNVNQADTNLYKIDLVTVYGDDSGLSQPTDPANVTCSGDLSSQGFCYVSRLSAYALEGISG